MTLEEWLGKDNQVGINIMQTKYLRNEETLEEWFDRVSGGNALLKLIIKKKRFMLAGRILANRGTNIGSYSNCYSHGFVEDSIVDIMDTCKNIALTFKAQGGQGISLSKLRPQGSDIKGGIFKSDGIVPFMKLFNSVTDTISQGGSRKGALMMTCSAEHGDIEKFITIKQNLSEIERANLSIEMSDDFMEKIIDKEDEDSIKKMDLICEQAWKHGEPGVIFTDEFRNYNFMQYVDGYDIETCNPCGEQPLPKHGACLLGSFNLSEYVVDPFNNPVFDYTNFKTDIHVVVQEMNKILDENLPLHALKEQMEMARNYRNIGIGVMGMADMLIKMELKYGSEDACVFLDELFKFMLTEAVIASSKLGKFPKYDSKIFDSDIMRQLDIPKGIDSLYNCSLLSIAPTGSISTMLGVSGGIEPIFAKSYTRTTMINGEPQDFLIKTKIVEDYMNKFNVKYIKDLPDYFITAKEINYKDRIVTQSIIQNWIDSAISSTINLHNEVTPADIKDIYIEACKLRLKGLTVFREGCERDAILNNNDCEVCGAAMVNSEGCKTCLQCGNGRCG